VGYLDDDGADVRFLLAELSSLRGRVEQAESERDEWKATAEVLQETDSMAVLFADQRERAERRVEQAEKALRTISNMRYLGALTAGPHPFIEAREIADAYFAARAVVSAAPDNLEHSVRRMLQSLDAYWLGWDGLPKGRYPRGRYSSEDWWHRFEGYRARVESLISPVPTPVSSAAPEDA
jgi:hypothetical protein